MSGALSVTQIPLAAQSLLREGNKEGSEEVNELSPLILRKDLTRQRLLCNYFCTKQNEACHEEDEHL
jgi:hypothetical protein